jgi:hypothetical protein
MSRNQAVRGEEKMRVRSLWCAAILFVTMAPVAVHAQADNPGTCPNDSKLLNGGPTAVFGEGPGTWWGLVINGLIEAGFVEEDQQIDYLNSIFGTDFTTLDEIEDYNLQLLEDTWDTNHNGYVCAFALRGTRAYYQNPYINVTFFGVGDDKIHKK